LRNQIGGQRQRRARRKQPGNEIHAMRGFIRKRIQDLKENQGGRRFID